MKKFVTAVALTAFAMAGIFTTAHAQTATSSAETNAELIAQLGGQVTALTAQIENLRVQIQAQREANAEPKAEVRELRVELQSQLRLGMSGEEVRLLQEFLASNLELYPEALITGYYGHLTEKAVKRLQEKYGIAAVGEVGPLTRARIKELIAERKLMVKQDEINGEECIVTDKDTGKTVALSTSFSSGFEAEQFLDLFQPGAWSGTLLLSPKADTVEKHVALNKELMEGGDFLDNRIDLESKTVHSGKRSARFYAVAPTPGMVTSKSLVEKKHLCFRNGDDLWFSGWFYLEENTPSTLVDFEAATLQGGPGMRLFIRSNKYASLEAKFLDKPQYNQTDVEIPHKEWVRFRLHLKLSHNDDGVIELWQNERKIISTNGKTMPLSDVIYNRMQVGITATQSETVLFVDDIFVSNKPIF
ncbi:heparin lyase I family protein [bacterium]|nr:heparin lyase I family protein [bacterium]